MAKYIRRPTVFNQNSEREMRIWNWAKDKTDNFKKQNFASFVRDQLEVCMMNERNQVQIIEPRQPHKDPDTETKKEGWSSLV